MARASPQGEILQEQLNPLLSMRSRIMALYIQTSPRGHRRKKIGCAISYGKLSGEGVDYFFRGLFSYHGTWRLVISGQRASSAEILI